MVETLQKRPKTQSKWLPCEPTAAELKKAKQNATDQSQFDTLGLKRGIWQQYEAGKIVLTCKFLPYARVLAFSNDGPDWDLWARIFDWFGPSPSGKPWLVVWYAAESPRRFPSVGQELGAEHVNGGYTQYCSTDGIFIYRKEEASRVLVHEMIHATCMDDTALSLPQREANVETWAELILIAILSGGSKSKAAALWKKQAHWVSSTNHKAAAQHGSHDETDYGWRYLNGRALMYAQLGILLPAPKAHGNSTRFTHPDLGV